MSKDRRDTVKAGFGREKPALVVAMIALFVALSSTGFAASIAPLAKRAFTADKAKIATTANNSLKLQGATAAQIAAIPGPGTEAATLNGQTAAQIAAIPSPVSSLSASMFTYRTDSFELSQEGATSRVTANCQAGERAVGGGWDQTDGAAYVLRDSPRQDGTGWQFTIWGESGNNLAAVGTVWAVCAKVS